MSTTTLATENLAGSEGNHTDDDVESKPQTKENVKPETKVKAALNKLKSGHIWQRIETEQQPPPVQFLVNTLLQLAAFTIGIAFGVFAIKAVDIGNEANVIGNKANKYADDAGLLAQAANRLALISMCIDSEKLKLLPDVADLCSRVIQAAMPSLESAAASMFDLKATPRSYTTTIVTTSTNVIVSTLPKVTTKAPGQMTIMTIAPEPTTLTQTFVATRTLTTASTIETGRLSGSASSAPNSGSGASISSSTMIAIALGIVGGLVLVAAGLVVILKITRRKRLLQPVEEAAAQADKQSGWSSFVATFRWLFMDTRVITRTRLEFDKEQPDGASVMSEPGEKVRRRVPATMDSPQ